MDLSTEHYFTILQNLKEKAIDLEKMIDKKSSLIGKEDEENSIEILEKDLIKVRSWEW